MKKRLLAFLLITCTVLSGFMLYHPVEDKKILSHVIDLKEQQLQLYWKDAQGKNYGNFKHLKTALNEEGKELIFAMNGGMYLEDASPQGLYIENGNTLKKTNTVKNNLFIKN